MKSRIPTVIAIIFLVLSVAIGFVLIQNKQIFNLGAVPQVVPQDVRVSNVSDSAFTVSWVTDKETLGFVVWGKTKELGKTTPEDQAKYVHSITLSELEANSAYFFKISSQGKEYDNSGIPWSSTTAAEIGAPPNSFVSSGTILTTENQPAANVLVYITAGGAASLSGQTSTNGVWIIPISQARKPDLTSYIDLVTTNTLIEIFVQGGPQGIATAKVFAKGTDPTPSIILGQNHDFRNESTDKNSQLPRSSLDIPEEESAISGFNIPSSSPSPNPLNVSLESIKQGEIVNSTSPKFFGKGPKGVTITIKINSSSEISGQVTIGPNGQWSWTPPDNLEEGKHEIEISYIENGVTKILTRTFTVLAAEIDPASESSPSAPTTTPTATPKPTPSPKPTLKPSPTATSRVSHPANGSETPVAGSLTATYLLFTMGLGFLAVSFFIWKKINA